MVDTKVERSIFGKLAKYIFIIFNIIMFIALISIFLSIDSFDVFSPGLYEDKEKMSEFMMKGTFLWSCDYFFSFNIF